MGTACLLCETGHLLPRGGWLVCSYGKCGAWFNTHTRDARSREWWPLPWPDTP